MSRIDIFYNIISAVLLPFVLLFSIPLVALSIVTSIFAFWVLLIRVSIVYVELLAALLWSYIVPERRYLKATLVPDSPTRSPTSIAARSRRASRSSIYSDDHYPPLGGPSRSAVTLPEPLAQRDYEGVGGWRDEDDGDAIWFGLNSRLELPLSTLQREHSSQTSLALMASGQNSPERVRTPHAHRTSTAMKNNHAGTESPESYFDATHAKTEAAGHRNTALLSGIGKPAASGSTASLARGSHRRHPTQ